MDRECKAQSCTSCDNHLGMEDFLMPTGCWKCYVLFAIRWIGKQDVFWSHRIQLGFFLLLLITYLTLGNVSK